MKYILVSSFLLLALARSVEMVKAPVDFEEEWCKISNGNLEIKWFYFPITTSKNIDIDKIQKVQIQRQDKGYAKNWGSGDLETWWACDMKRNFRSHPERFYNVKVDIGETFKKGFTVNELDKFLVAIRKWLKVQDIEFE
uniref:Type_ISP_C domain-containing protein n=2 Tax=Caenorhabditis tropicalis TaxID=1561998 RepID=A0A1I7USE5_9PELO